MEEETLKIFNKEQEQIFANIWTDIVSAGIEIAPLCSFPTQVGSLYKNEGDCPMGIKLSGRSINGWDGSSVLDRGHLFPAHRSAFIKVGRLLAEHFYGGSFPEEHLCWSNTARVSFIDSGNPGKKLWEAQQGGACALEELEQRILAPQVNIYITGADDDWDAPLWTGFLNTHDCSQAILRRSFTNRGGDVCNILGYESEGRLYVITDRPEKFCLKKFSESLISLVEDWMSGRSD